MPIVFQQPQPFSPLVSAQTGALHQYEKNREFQQRQQQQAFQQRLQTAQFQQHQQEYQDAPYREQQRAQLDVDRYLAQNQGALSQAEQMRFQQVQQGDAWLDQQVTEGFLDPEDVMDAKMHTRKMIGYYEQRIQKAQAERMQQQKQQMIDQAAMQKVIEDRAAQISSQSADSRVRPIYADGQSPVEPGQAQPQPSPGMEPGEAQFQPEGQYDPGYAQGGPGPMDSQARGESYPDATVKPQPKQHAPIGHLVLEGVDAHGHDKWNFHPYKPAVDGPLPIVQLPDLDNPGQSLPGNYQVKPDGTYHLIPTPKPEAVVKPAATPTTIVSKITSEEGKIAKDTDTLGEIKVYDMPGGKGVMAFPADTRYSELPDWARKQEAKRRVAERYEEATGERPSWADQPTTPATQPQAAAPQAAAPKLPFTDAQMEAELKKRQAEDVLSKLESRTGVMAHGG